MGGTGLRPLVHAILAGFVSIGTCVAFAQNGAASGEQLPDVFPKLPQPGPFGVGRVGYEWVDTARPDPYSKLPKAHRELMVYFWYPTLPKSAAAKGAYLPGAPQMESNPEIQGEMRGEFGKNWPGILSGAIFSHAVERASIAKSPPRFPVIIFSHGLGGSGFGYTCLIEDLVGRGYVVASIEHTYTASVVWFPDGRVVPRRNDPPPAGLSPGEGLKRMAAGAMEAVSQGAADVRFVLDRLSAANGNPQRFLLAGRIDLGRVAAMGHSAGAEFAARACQLDARFRACVDLDGGMVPIAALPEYPDGATMQQPLLFLEAYHPESQMFGTAAQHAQYFKKKEEQLQATRPGTYSVVLQSPGIAHPSFSDTPLLFAGQDGYPETGAVLHNLDLIEKFVRDFLGKTLKQEKSAVLDADDPAAAPEATVQRYGR